jgi:hypothetical protein
MILSPTFENTRSSAALAAAFGWSDAQLHRVDLRRGETIIDAQKGSISGEPAAVFATVISRNGRDPLSDVALYAYHASVAWGLLADDAGLTIFNSQWLIETDWFRLPHISWQSINGRQALLDAFTPNGLLEQKPSRVATEFREPDDFLKPIDDSLVDRLDRWRDEALRYASQTDRVDELLQTYYAQLFVLRTVEDRKLALGLDRVTFAINLGRIAQNRERLSRRTQLLIQ